MLNLPILQFSNINDAKLVLWWFSFFVILARAINFAITSSYFDLFNIIFKFRDQIFFDLDLAIDL
jgi:hypothetical protein